MKQILEKLKIKTNANNLLTHSNGNVIKTKDGKTLQLFKDGDVGKHPYNGDFWFNPILESLFHGKSPSQEIMYDIASKNLSNIVLKLIRKYIKTISSKDESNTFVNFVIEFRNISSLTKAFTAAVNGCEGEPFKFKFFDSFEYNKKYGTEYFSVVKLESELLDNISKLKDDITRKALTKLIKNIVDLKTYGSSNDDRSMYVAFAEMAYNKNILKSNSFAKNIGGTENETLPLEEEFKPILVETIDPRLERKEIVEDVKIATVDDAKEPKDSTVRYAKRKTRVVKSKAPVSKPPYVKPAEPVAPIPQQNPIIPQAQAFTPQTTEDGWIITQGPELNKPTQFDQFGRPIQQQTDQFGRPIVQQGYPPQHQQQLDQFGRPMGVQTNCYPQQQQQTDQFGRPLQQQGYPPQQQLDQFGRPMEPQAQFYPQQQPQTDQFGRPLHPQQPQQQIDQWGRPIEPQAQCHPQQQQTDQFGRPIEPQMGVGQPNGTIPPVYTMGSAFNAAANGTHHVNDTAPTSNMLERGQDVSTLSAFGL